MNLSEIDLTNMSISFKEQAIRLFFAFIIGTLIGIERTNARKPAGVRTHAMLCLICTMLTMVSTYGFDYLGLESDPTRLISNIITGVGFVAGGVIYFVSKSQEIKGLTTSVGVWGAACLGIPIGLGHYSLVILTFILMQISIKFDVFLRKIHIIDTKNKNDIDE